MMSRKAIHLSFRQDENAVQVNALLRKYSNVPMSVADACLVWMAEQSPNSEILTLDSDFKIYRRHCRQVIPLISR